MNFNFGAKEFDLMSEQAEELIRLYGAPIKLIITEKLNKDLIFGDFSHFKADSKNVFDFYALPENSEAYDEYERLQTQFGIPGDSTVNFFIAKNSMYQLMQKSFNYVNDFDFTNPDNFKKLISALVVVPSGRIFEITDISLDNPGMTTSFLNNLQKICFLISCREFIPHKASLKELKVDPVVDDLDINKSEIPKGSDMLQSLDSYFNELVEKTNLQDSDAEKYLKTDDIFGRF